jgi:hypothetical protein
MSTIHEKKRQEMLDTPLMVFDCTLADGRVERWCTHRVRVEGEDYEPRVLRHGGFEMKLYGEEAVDTGARFSLILSNVDRMVSQLDAAVGWKGAKLSVRFGFFDLDSGEATSEITAVYAGVANPVEELTETEGRLSFTNRLNLQRLNVPGLRIQNRCPWRFPTTADERAEAKEGGERGSYSQFYRCGYSADSEGGVGNLSGGEAYSSCGRTREECQARGMLREDEHGRPAARFGGFAFLPPSVTVRSHGEKSSVTSSAMDGRAVANDAVPIVYGSAWITAPVIFSRNDGNLTHCEVLLGSGPIEGVCKVIANGVELPLGEAGRDMTATGWYNLVSSGERQGGFNMTFTDGEGKPAGDPHGSMACLSVVLPNAIVQQSRLPKVEVLLDGMKLTRYAEDRSSMGIAFTRNPAWILLDLLRRGSWEEGEIDLASFSRAAAYCEEFTTQKGPDGQQMEGPRFEANLALTRRQSLSEVVRGLRTSAALMVTVDEAGRVRVTPETTLAGQAATKPEGTNSIQTLAGGWPAYEFGDGLNGFGAILRKPDGRSTFRIWRRASSETANRLSVEFQDAYNQYQQDSLSLVDYEDAAAQGCEVSAASGALGLPHVDQAARILRMQIEKNLRGNKFIEFETSVQALGLRPGDLIAVSHSREGLDRTPFRVLRLSPELNHERARIVAQLHADEWYERAAGEWHDRSGQAEQGGGVPRPIAGRSVDESGREWYEIVEAEGTAADQAELAVRFTAPERPRIKKAAPPIVNLAADVTTGGGTLQGGRAIYYAVSSVDAEGAESGLSFTVRAVLPGGAATYAVRLEGIRCAREGVSMRVYRGRTPSKLRCIADGVPPSSEFTDPGLASSQKPPPDANFDHARFQWRFEQLPETLAGIYGAISIGSPELGMLPNEFAGSVARIMSGRGEGQERIIRSHTSTVLEMEQPWTVAPDGTSVFTIAEATWKTAGSTRTDEIRILVPNRPGQVVQVLGVAVSAAGMESAGGEALVGRQRIEGQYAGWDADVPGEPNFGITAAGQGAVEVAGIGMASLDNTNTIRTGTLTLHHWDELQNPSPYALSEAIDGESTAVMATAGFPGTVGDLLQTDSELVRVLAVGENGAALEVERGCHETLAQPHALGSPIYPLQRRTEVMAFVKGFFGSPASGSYRHRFDLPNVRISAAELYLTNDRGHSPTGTQAFTMTTAGGLRTMSGGQYCLQYEGELAIMASISPMITVEARHSVMDMRAQLGVAPIGEPVVVRIAVNEVEYARLTIPAGSKLSNIETGWGKAALPEGARLSVEILSVGTSGGSYPGRDLTVTIRL